MEGYSLSNKKLTTEKILKLINLINNYSISELVDSCLVKNQKKTNNIFDDFLSSWDWHCGRNW